MCVGVCFHAAVYHPPILSNSVRFWTIKAILTSQRWASPSSQTDTRLNEELPLSKQWFTRLNIHTSNRRASFSLASLSQSSLLPSQADQRPSDLFPNLTNKSPCTVSRWLSTPRYTAQTQTTINPQLSVLKYFVAVEGVLVWTVGWWFKCPALQVLFSVLWWNIKMSELLYSLKLVFFEL